MGPLIISMVYKYADIGSIGPLVLIYAILSTPIFIVIYSMFLLKKYSPLMAVPLGVLGGVLMAILLINYFMFVTYGFKIHDYNPM